MVCCMFFVVLCYCCICLWESSCLILHTNLSQYFDSVIIMCRSLIFVIYRSAYCDANLPPEGLRAVLPRLIPVCVWCQCLSSIIIYRIILKYKFSCLWSVIYRFYYQIWHMLMMMNHYLTPRYICHCHFCDICYFQCYSAFYIDLFDEHNFSPFLSLLISGRWVLSW